MKIDDVPVGLIVVLQLSVAYGYVAGGLLRSAVRYRRWKLAPLMLVWPVLIIPMLVEKWRDRRSQDQLMQGDCR
jgi:hypothetical protein